MGMRNFLLDYLERTEKNRMDLLLCERLLKGAARTGPFGFYDAPTKAQRGSGFVHLLRQPKLHLGCVLSRSVLSNRLINRAQPQRLGDGLEPSPAGRRHSRASAPFTMERGGQVRPVLSARGFPRA
jgi:hypothetical protein